MGDDVKIISDEVWASAKSEMRKEFQQSSRLDVCNNLIKQFEDTNSKRKYKSDLEAFVRESKLEDFYNETGETIFVSTIHKAKGKEFDNVFIMLENFNPTTDEAKRQLYVAMTRAKRNLTIHLNGSYLDNITAENLESVEDNNTFQPPNGLALHLSHKDLNLGYFGYIQRRIDGLASGDAIQVSDEGCTNETGEPVLKFSKNFLDRLVEIKKSGFKPKEAKVNYIVYWKDDEKNIEVKIVLPELQFEKLQ